MQGGTDDSQVHCPHPDHSEKYYAKVKEIVP
nr:MAG TPA: Protein of unknown function DUF45 [Caudoviricetes sp.]